MYVCQDVKCKRPGTSSLRFSKVRSVQLHEWKRHMRWFLMGEDLWSYVEGSEVKPEDSDVAD